MKKAKLQERPPLLPGLGKITKRGNIPKKGFEETKQKD